MECCEIENWSKIRRFQEENKFGKLLFSTNNVLIQI